MLSSIFKTVTKVFGSKADRDLKPIYPLVTQINAEIDAYHVAIATVNGMEYLLTWNCTHIANAHTLPKIEATCRALG